MVKFYLKSDLNTSFSIEELVKLDNITLDTDISIDKVEWIKVAELPNSNSFFPTEKDLYSIYIPTEKKGSELIILEEVIKRGVNFDTLIWKKGTFHEWKRAALFTELEEYFKSVPPPPLSDDDYSNTPPPPVENQSNNDKEPSKDIKNMLVPGEMVVFIGKIHPRFLLSSLKFWNKIDKYHSHEYVITNKRLLHKSGTLRKKSNTMNISQIEDIEVNQSLLGQVLGFGDVEVSGTGGKKILFDCIEKPNIFRDKIIELQRK